MTQPSVDLLTSNTNGLINEPLKEAPTQEQLAALGYNSPVGLDFGWSLSRLEGLQPNPVSVTKSSRGDYNSMSTTNPNAKASHGSHLCQKNG